MRVSSAASALRSARRLAASLRCLSSTSVAGFEAEAFPSLPAATAVVWPPRSALALAPCEGGLTSFQVLCISLAARVGSGNLAGVALAIAVGGPGAVFWMWVAAIIGMASSFAECSLAQLYKERDANGQFRGGPAWYMSRGLGMRWMGVLFSLFLLLAYGLIFNTVQANSTAHALKYAFDVPRSATGIVMAFFALLVMVRGIKGVARLSQWLVPFMALLWVSVCWACHLPSV